MDEQLTLPGIEPPCPDAIMRRQVAELQSSVKEVLDLLLQVQRRLVRVETRVTTFILDQEAH